MANTVAAGLIDDAVNGAALQGFIDTLPDASTFSTDVSMGGNKTVDVPLFAADSAADFAGSYAGTDSTVGTIQVVASEHKFVPIHVTDIEQLNSSNVNLLEGLGYQAGAALGAAVYADILSIVTNANFSQKVTEAVVDTDTDTVVSLKALLDTAKAPPVRNLHLGSAPFNNLLKDTGINVANSYGSTDAIRGGNIPGLFGMNIHESTAIPANAENLVGFASVPSAIAILTRYVEPQDPSQYSAAMPLEAGGYVMGMRRYYDPATGKHHLSYECSYGKSVGQATGLARLVTA